MGQAVVVGIHDDEVRQAHSGFDRLARCVKKEGRRSTDRINHCFGPFIPSYWCGPRRRLGRALIEAERQETEEQKADRIVRGGELRQLWCRESELLGRRKGDLAKGAIARR